MADAIRIDKLLWFLRLTKTRALAQETVAQGHVRASGRIVDRAHHMIHIGDVLTFPLHGRVRVIRLVAMPHRRGPAGEAQACYVDLAKADPGERAELPASPEN